MVFIMRIVWLPVAVVVAFKGQFPFYEGSSILFLLGVVGFGLWDGDIRRLFS